MAYALSSPPLPISEALIASLAVEWERFAAPGTWWTGAERLAIASAARDSLACALCRDRKQALSPTAVSGIHAGNPALPDTVVDAVHRIATDPGRLSSHWYAELVSSGTTPEQIVELVGLLGLLTIGDTLARACDVAPPTLPGVSAPGAPSEELPSGLSNSRAWVPMVDPDRAEGGVKLMYDMVQRSAGFVFNVARALTAVPAEVQAFFGVFLQSYATHGPAPEGGLTRPQMELVASTVSGANDCFY